MIINSCIILPTVYVPTLQSYVPSSAAGPFLLGNTSLNRIEGSDVHQVLVLQYKPACPVAYSIVAGREYIVPPREVGDLVSPCHPDSEVSGLTLINLNPFTKVHGGMSDRKLQD